MTGDRYHSGRISGSLVNLTLIGLTVEQVKTIIEILKK
jgi:hypothetical protein